MAHRFHHVMIICTRSIDTLSDIHYMCMQSRRLRGASAEASYEVGRDAAPAGVAYATTSPGGRRAASTGYYWLCAGPAAVQRESGNDAAVARREARALAS